jgi:2-methylcitrate dehydratase PrpD
VIERAKQCILDQLGVQLRGATLPQVQSVRQMVQATGGNTQATVVHHGFKTSVPLPRTSTAASATLASSMTATSTAATRACA